MKELILKIRKVVYSKFGQYIGTFGVLLMGGIIIINASLKVNSIILGVAGGVLIVGSLIIFMSSLNKSKSN